MELVLHGLVMLPKEVGLGLMIDTKQQKGGNLSPLFASLSYLKSYVGSKAVV
jgi:hypothetical protein